MGRFASAARAGAGRPALAGASILLALTLLLPLWSTRMEAPQYKDEEALVVDVFAGRVIGDIDEIDLLNQYVGVHLPLDTPELAASPWILGVFLMLSLLALALPLAARRRAALALCVLMAATLLAGGALLQYRLYQMGHDRSPSIMARVPDFTPPVLGSKKIANFWAHMSLGSGAWTYVGAILLAAWAARQGRRAAVERAAESRHWPGRPADGAARGGRREIPNDLACSRAGGRS